MITKINEQDFQTKVVNDEVAVVDFSATWCGPCRMLAPVLEEISEDLGDKANFYNVDVDESAPLAIGFGISSEEQVRDAIRNGTSGAITGSALVNIVEENLDNKAVMLEKIAQKVRELKAGTRGN